MPKVILQKNDSGEIDALDRIELERIHGDYLAGVMLTDDGVEIPFHLLMNYIRAKGALQTARESLKTYMKE